MKGVILTVCGFVLGGVFLAMYRAIWSNRDDPARLSAFRQRLSVEVIWATIPLLMLLAAAIPAVLGVVSRSGHWR